MLLFAATALISSLALADLTHPTPAAAASTGAGIPGLTPEGGYLGNYIAPDGARVYCIDSSRQWPGGETSGGELVGAITTTWGAALAPEVLQKLNYALLGYGQTDDPVQAAAVAAYVNAYTSGWARDLGASYAAGAYYLNGNPDVIAVYDHIWSDADANALSAGSASLAIEMTDTTAGVVRVVATPSDAVGTLHLEGAVVADTGASTAQVSDGAVIAIQGTPGDDQGAYSVAASATFSMVTPAAPVVVLYTTGDQQRTIRGGTPGSLEFYAETATAVALDFAPVLQTTVSQAQVEIGQPFVDAVTASVAEGSKPWRVLSDGSLLPVVAHGVLYGPFAEHPALADRAPAGAPVVGEQQIVLTGPGDYLSDSSLVASQPGYYTWVWSVESARQGAATAASLPADYSFVSQFGIAEETHWVPTPPTPPAELARTGSTSTGLAPVALGLLVLGSALGIVRRVVR